MKKKVLIILAIVVVIGIIIVSSMFSKGKSGAEVEVEICELGDIAPTVTAEGLISALVTVNISSQVMGEIQRIHFKEGDPVKKGNVLVELNPDTYERDVASSRANVLALEAVSRQAEITLQQRERDWVRAQDLFQQKIYSDQQLDDARLAHDSAKYSSEQTRAQVQQARASLQRSQDYLQKTILRSPVDAVVTAVNVKEGEQAIIGTMNNPGTVLITVSDLSEIITEIQVDEVDLPRLALDQEALIIVDALGGKQYKGKVVEIGASAHGSAGGVQANIRQFTVKVAVAEPDEKLRPGITARVKLYAEKRENVVKAPIGAIRTEEEEGVDIFYVFVADKQKAVKKAIKTGLSDDLDTEITEGLEKGEKVITGPYRLLRTLRDGDKIQYKEPKPDKKKEEPAESEEKEEKEAGESDES